MPEENLMIETPPVQHKPDWRVLALRIALYAALPTLLISGGMVVEGWQLWATLVLVLVINEVDRATELVRMREQTAELREYTELLYAAHLRAIGYIKELIGTAETSADAPPVK